MITLDYFEIQRVTGGSLQGAEGALPVTGCLQVDSRKVAPGDIFAAVVGSQVDGHDFLEAASAAGARLAVVSRLQPVSTPQLLVPDVVAALGQLAAYKLSLVRDRVTVVGITGSNGKTTAKELVGRVLERFAPTVVTAGSFNNEIGFPLTVSRVQADTRYLVLEYGASAPGDITLLRQIASPDIGVVLLAGYSHIDNNGSLESVCRMKAELVLGLPAGAKVLLNRNDALVSQISAPGAYFFGTAPGSDFWAQEVEADMRGTRFQLVVTGGAEDAGGGELKQPVSVQLLGEHQVFNALAALGVFALLGLDIARCAQYLSQIPAAVGRMQPLSAGGVSIINDAYNASLESVKSALSALARLGTKAPRRIAVLGDIYGMGDHTLEAYRQIAEQCVRLNLDLLVIVGARPLYLLAIAEGTWDTKVVWYEDLASAREELAAWFCPGDLVLFKASNRAGFLELVSYVRDKLEPIE